MSFRWNQFYVLISFCFALIIYYVAQTQPQHLSSLNNKANKSSYQATSRKTQSLVEEDSTDEEDGLEEVTGTEWRLMNDVNMYRYHNRYLEVIKEFGDRAL